MSGNKTAKYEHAYTVLLGRLKGGRYPVGGRMPTEIELANQFAVSRVTIRRALDILVHDGYLERKQGSGYRVLTLSPASDTCLTSYTDAMLRAGLEPQSRFLSLELLTPLTREPHLQEPHLQEPYLQEPRSIEPYIQKPQSEGLQLVAPGQLPAGLHAVPVTRVTRLRLLNDVPQMLVQTCVPSSMMRGACAEDFPETGPDQSILRILAARFKLTWSAACEEISPIAADAKTAELLEVALHHPLLMQSCSSFDEQGAVVFHENVYRKGSVSFNLTQQTRRPRHQGADRQFRGEPCENA